MGTRDGGSGASQHVTILGFFVMSQHSLTKKSNKMKRQIPQERAQGSSVASTIWTRSLSCTNPNHLLTEKYKANGINWLVVRIFAEFLRRRPEFVSSQQNPLHWSEY
eukprot:972396-Prymnesium_polylepis.1